MKHAQEIQRIAREQSMTRLLADVRADMVMSKAAGTSVTEFIDELMVMLAALRMKGAQEDE